MNTTEKELLEALETMRAVVPKVIKALMNSGRDNLLLADEVHKADDKARTAIAKVQGN